VDYSASLRFLKRAYQLPVWSSITNSHQFFTDSSGIYSQGRMGFAVVASLFDLSAESADLFPSPHLSQSVENHKSNSKWMTQMSQNRLCCSINMLPHIV
jgi:hypothetical protein